MSEREESTLGRLAGGRSRTSAGSSSSEAASTGGPAAGASTPTRPGPGGSEPTTPVAAKSAERSRRTARKPRTAHLRLTHLDPWSVMKTAFLLSISLGIVMVVAVVIVWSVLGASGVFDSINSIAQSVGGKTFQVQDYIGTGRVLGLTMILAVVNVVLLTALATLAAFLYNLSATLVGGIEVTFAEDR